MEDAICPRAQWCDKNCIFGCPRIKRSHAICHHRRDQRARFFFSLSFSRCFAISMIRWFRWINLLSIHLSSGQDPLIVSDNDISAPFQIDSRSCRLLFHAPSSYTSFANLVLIVPRKRSFENSVSNSFPGSFFFPVPGLFFKKYGIFRSYTLSEGENDCK